MGILGAIKTNFQLDRKYSVAAAKGFHPIDRSLYRQFNRFRPMGPKPVFCYLPYNSLTFSFGGQVFVCSYNRDVQLGKYPDNSIDEIWNGAEAKKLREHMLYNDLDYGCRHCKYFFDKGKFTNLRPLAFDKYSDNMDAAYPQVFEFELSNECNLECQMCHGEVSSSIRKNREKLPPLPMHYDDAFVDQFVKYIPTLKEAKFYGGEPFLIPIYYKIWEKVRELNPKLEMFVITNGTHWNAKIEKLVNELNFDMAISIDAFEKEKVERIRKNVVYEKLMDNIKRFSEILTRKGKYLSLSFTVQKDNWEQFPLIIDLCNEVNAFIYVSYLERPVRFALADLPQDELRKIREYMDKYTFPKGNQREQHNDKCFEDFKHYLDAYVEHADVKKYADYGFNRDMLISAEAEQKEEFKEAIPVPFSVLGAWIEGQYSANKTFSEKLPKEIMFRQLNTLLSTFSEEDRNQLHAIIMQGAFEPFLNSVKTEAQEQLKQSGYDTLEKYRRLMTEVV